MKPTNSSWTPFYFDGNQAFGLVDTPQEWERIKTAYRSNPGGHATPAELLTARNCPRERGCAKFGFVVECDGPLTLGQFFAQHGMEVGKL